MNSRGKKLNVKLVETIARWVGKMLRMFGLGEEGHEDIGWGQDSQQNGNINVGFHLLCTFPLLLTLVFLTKEGGSVDAISSITIILPRRSAAVSYGKE